MYRTDEFKQAVEDDRRNLFGNLFYEYVAPIVGEEYAPKIVGMLIDLKGRFLYEMAATHQTMKTRAQEALKLVQSSRQKENAQQPQ